MARGKYPYEHWNKTDFEAPHAHVDIKNDKNTYKKQKVI